MNVGIIGSGKLACILAQTWSKHKHRVCFGAETEADRAAAISAASELPNATTGTFADAAGFGDVIFVATPWSDSLCATLGSHRQRLAGKTVLDSTNPIDASGELVPTERWSFAELLAQSLPESSVVKAANAVSPETLEYVFAKQRPYIQGQPLTIFYCGDDVAAKQTAAGLIGETNLEPVDVGPLRTARLLEPLGVFAQKLSRSGTLGPAVAINAVHEGRDHSPLDPFF